jgi:hypothetical protein
LTDSIVIGLALPSEETRLMRKKRRAKKVAAEIVDFSELTPEETRDRLHLERKVERAFYEAGLALAEIRERQLYRSTHMNFESYCRERFQFSRDSAYLKMAAAEVYRNLEDNLPTNCRQHNDEIPLPTNENQVRYLAKSSLPPAQQVEVWQLAVEEAGGKRPSGRLVRDVVQRIRERSPQAIPFRVGEVCQIIVKDNPELRGKGGCWCIVSSVDDFSCTVNTFDNEYHLRPENLKSLEFTEFECKRIEDIGVRMSELYQKKLDDAAYWVLNGLARIDRAYLTELEEKLLLVLEREYGRRKS